MDNFFNRIGSDSTEFEILIFIQQLDLPYSTGKTFVQLKRGQNKYESETVEVKNKKAVFNEELLDFKTKVFMKGHKYLSKTVIYFRKR